MSATETPMFGANAASPERRMRATGLRAWLADSYNLWFAGLVAASLLPILSFRYFPSQDGPSHLDNANLLRLYPWHGVPVFHEFYVLNALPLPNWFGHAVLATLMTAVPAIAAEKIYLCAYVVALPVAIRSCIRALNPVAGATTLLPFLYIYNLPFQMGFYNFSASVVMFFVCVGYWIRHRDELTATRTAILLLLFLVLYFCHLVSLALAFGTIGLLWIWLTLAALRAAANEQAPARRAIWRSAASAAGRTFIAVLPAVALAFWYLHYQGIASGDTLSVWHLIVPKALAFAEKVAAHQRWEMRILVLWELFLVGLGVRALRARLRGGIRGPATRDAPLVLFVAYVILYFALPNYIGGGGGLGIRLVLYSWLALTWWLAAQPHSRLLGRLIAGASTVFALALLTVNMISYSVLDGYLAEYVSAARFIRPGSTLLPIDLGEPPGLRRTRVLLTPANPFLHAAGYIAARRQLVDFTNYEAHETYFPTRFLSTADPYVHIGSAEHRPYVLDFATYHARTGRSVDYVLLWGERDPAADPSPDVRSVMRQLRAGYGLVYRSPGRGLVRLYRRVAKK